jgi:hypothetical protein
MAAVAPSPGAAAFSRLESDSVAVSCDCEPFFDLPLLCDSVNDSDRTVRDSMGPGGQARLAEPIGV